MDDLLASVTSDMLSDLPQNFGDNTIHVERILLEMVRPDPVQPRRVLPESIHLRFHNNHVTPTQALRELVQIVQIAAHDIVVDRSTTCWSCSPVRSMSVRTNRRRILTPEEQHFYVIWSIWRSQFETMGRSIR